VTRVSRWCGLLEVVDGPFEDSEPVFSDPDPFTVRFRVDCKIWLPLDRAIPIYDDSLWSELSITRPYEPGTSTWTGFFRSSLNRLEEADGDLIVRLLTEQAS